MGIYRETRYTDSDGRPLSSLAYAQGREVTIHVSEPGLEYTATLKPEDWTETRTDCFCCSCGDREGSDVACRNHGFAAKRPCEAHGTPGSPWPVDFENDDAIGPEQMPESVQAIRKQQSELEAAEIGG